MKTLVANLPQEVRLEVKQNMTDFTVKSAVTAKTLYHNLNFHLDEELSRHFKLLEIPSVLRESMNFILKKCIYNLHTNIMFSSSCPA